MRDISENLPKAWFLLTITVVISLVLAVGDAEESIGRDTRRVAEHLRDLGLPFEIIAVNDGCRDNSLAVLRLLNLPELRLCTADVAGRAFARGTAEATGDVVVLVETGYGSCPLAALGWALGRLAAGTDAVVFRGRCLVARRLACLSSIVRAAGRGILFEASFERHARSLSVEIVGNRGRRASLLDPVLRFLAA